jgi:hypothetical protein
VSLEVNPRIRFRVPARWLKAHPLTAHMLEREAQEWTQQGYAWKAAS